MDLDMAKFEQYLSPLRNVTNVKEVFLVASPNSDVLFSLYQDVDLSLKTLSGHIFNVADGQAKTIEQQEFESKFFEVFNDD